MPSPAATKPPSYIEAVAVVSSLREAHMADYERLVAHFGTTLVPLLAHFAMFLADQHAMLQNKHTALTGSDEPHVEAYDVLWAAAALLGDFDSETEGKDA